MTTLADLAWLDGLALADLVRAKKYRRWNWSMPPSPASKP